MAAGSVTAVAPGRVNLIGEHTDHSGGLALPFAIDRAVTVRVTALPGPLVMVRARDLREDDTFDMWRPGPTSGWRAFVRGIVAELRAEDFPIRAARIEISGTIPRGAGLGSSAALTAALSLALLDLAGVHEPDRRLLAGIAQRVEHHWVGARTGALDQFASLLSIDGHALRIDFRTHEAKPVPLELAGWSLALLRSGEAREHSDSGYNDRRRECDEARDRLAVDVLAAADPDAVEELDDPWRSRARHVLTETARVDAAVDALQSGDIAALGPLLDASHASLRDDFAVSTPGLEATVERAKAAGAAGARLHGGGFGGAILALFPPDVPVPGGAIRVSPGPGARVV